MARKTVISDFSDLKGKVTFSERIPSVSVLKTPAAEVTERKSENALRVGQSVILMDSDLRGTIVSIGRSVGIELENGLVIQAVYGEFAVTDKSEINALKQARIKNSPAAVQAKKSISNTTGAILSVDLHIEALPGGSRVPSSRRLEFQINTFRRIIQENLSHRGMKICFIHGIGDGILKTAIRKELDEVLALRCSYSIGDPAVTIVTIK